MTRRTRRPSWPRRPQLCVEWLEDRTALSGLSGAMPQALVSVPASTAAPSAGSTPAYSNATSTNTAPDVPDGDDDDSTYTNDSGSGQSAAASGMTSPSSQATTGTRGPSTAIPSGSATDSRTETYSATAASSGQTTQLDGTYYPQDYAKEATGPADAYYAAESDQYAAEYAKQEAAEARQAEVVAFRALQQAEGSAEPRALHLSPAEAQVVEAAPNPSATSNGGLNTASAAARSGDSEAIPALHHRSVPADLIAELVNTADEQANQTVSSVPRGGETFAAAENETVATAPETGGLLTGAVPLDLEALERGVGRLFAHLEAQGRNWLTGPGVANLGWWLAAGTTATAAFELARRSARATAAGGDGMMAWHDPELSFFTSRDES